MQRKLDQWTTPLCVMVLVAALLACKKRTPVGTTPSAEVATAAPSLAAPPAVVTPPVPAVAAPESAAKLGEVSPPSSISMAICRLRCCDRSVVQMATSPVGTCVTFTPCGPVPTY